MSMFQFSVGSTKTDIAISLKAKLADELWDLAEAILNTSPTWLSSGRDFFTVWRRQEENVEAMLRKGDVYAEVAGKVNLGVIDRATLKAPIAVFVEMRVWDLANRWAFFAAFDLRGSGKGLKRDTRNFSERDVVIVVPASGRSVGLQYERVNSQVAMELAELSGIGKTYLGCTDKAAEVDLVRAWADGI